MNKKYTVLVNCLGVLIVGAWLYSNFLPNKPQGLLFVAQLGSALFSGIYIGKWILDLMKSRKQ